MLTESTLSSILANNALPLVSVYVLIYQQLLFVRSFPLESQWLIQHRSIRYSAQPINQPVVATMRYYIMFRVICWRLNVCCRKDEFDCVLFEVCSVCRLQGANTFFHAWDQQIQPMLRIEEISNVSHGLHLVGVYALPRRF